MAKKEVKSNKKYFKEFKAEIKKVIWPTPKQLVNNTVAIITMVIVVAALVFVLDKVFINIDKFTLSHIQQVVQDNNDENNQEQKENTNNPENKEQNPEEEKDKNSEQNKQENNNNENSNK